MYVLELYSASNLTLCRRKTIHHIVLSVSAQWPQLTPNFLPLLTSSTNLGASGRLLNILSKQAWRIARACFLSLPRGPGREDDTAKSAVEVQCTWTLPEASTTVIKLAMVGHLKLLKMVLCMTWHHLANAAKM